MGHDPLHQTADGTVMRIAEMSDRHLANAINLWERKAAEGLLVVEGGGFDQLELWFDTRVVFGQEALDRLNHAAYVAERERRAKEAT